MIELPDYLRNRTNRRQLTRIVTDGLGVSALPFVSTFGTSFTLVDSEGKRIPIQTPHLDCIIIDSNSHASRVYWGKDRQFDPDAKSNDPPECFSDNGIGASRDAVNPQSVRCDSCPQDAWGSAVSNVTGEGIPACSTIKKIVLLAYSHGAKDDDGFYSGEFAAEFPFLLRVPVMSRKNLRAFTDKFKGQEFDVSEVVTRISFERGQVGRLQFLPFAFIDPTTNDDVDKILATKITDNLVGRYDQPIEAMPDKALAKPVEQPKSAPHSLPAEPLQIAPAATAKAGRGRPRKTAEVVEESTGPFAAPQRKAPFASAPSHGIVTNAGQPPESVEKALDSLFNLKGGS